MKKKEEGNSLKLLNKNQKYKEISDKQRRNQEIDQLWAELYPRISDEPWQTSLCSRTIRKK